MIKVFLLVFVLFVGTGCQNNENPSSTPVSVVLPDTPENREALASRYFELVSFDKMMKGMGEEVSKQVPPDMQTSFKQYWANFMTPENTSRILEVAKNSLSKHMNSAELGAFVHFMEDPNGRSAMDKMKFYMADIMPLMQELTMKAAIGFKQVQPQNSQISK